LWLCFWLFMMADLVSGFKCIFLRSFCFMMCVLCLLNWAVRFSWSAIFRAVHVRERKNSLNQPSSIRWEITWLSLVGPRA
jgi:hypothetical protein